MTFSLPRITTHIGVDYELVRFCNKINTNVVGGASKLMNYFVKTYGLKKILSYADRRWSNGNLYFELGLEFQYNSKPNFYYVDNKRRVNRIKYQKHKLVNEGFDKNKTAHQICLERGLFRIYDCGHKVFIK